MQRCIIGLESRARVIPEGSIPLLSSKLKAKHLDVD